MDRRRVAPGLLLAFIVCIGAGLVQLLGELVILAATARLAMGIAQARRAR